MGFGNRFFLSVILCATLSIFCSIALAGSSTMDANVTISAISEITVKPNVINWTEVSLGAAGGNQTVTIENTGSVNVTNLYAYPDTVSDEIIRPYGNSSADAYAAGGVIALSNFTAAQYFFMGRMEWNWTESLQNLNTTNVDSPVSWGFFKNASSEYVWTVGNGTNGLCNDSDTGFAIDDSIDQGIMSTRTPDDASISNDYQDADYSYFSISRGTSSLDGYCVAVNTTCSYIYVYKYDKRPGFTQCANSRFITANQLPPGSKIQLGVDAFVPKGLPSGELRRATITFVAS